VEASNTKRTNDEKAIKTLHIDEKLHPLEAKFGREPKIQPTEQWHWH
jgi:hypothetical protein